ncbi:hypothetical protein EB796_012734 [Bugula neritina]|uniref:Uncharacterized protein n=1 Tax=Bugula neritina TaxID=10212 RepID=A0A7J7JSV6_BUGNE|nr:hypothetical protein EB796_012734 [Bugula neritina]
MGTEQKIKWGPQSSVDKFEIEVDEIKKNLNALGQSVGVNASTIETKVRGRYSENCARCQVPQNHISSVIRKIFELLFNSLFHLFLHMALSTTWCQKCGFY